MLNSLKRLGTWLLPSAWSWFVLRLKSSGRLIKPLNLKDLRMKRAIL